MNPDNVNRNLFSTNQSGSAETDDGSECSEESILDTMARIDTQIRLRDVNVELAQEAESEEADAGVDEQTSPEVGKNTINYLASPTGTMPYDAMTGASGTTVTDDRNTNRKKKLLVEKLYLEKELKRRIELKKNKRVRPERFLVKSFLDARPGCRATVGPNELRHALFQFTTRELGEDEYLPQQADDVAGKKEWSKKFEKFLNPNGHALGIFQLNGKWKWPVDMTVDMFADYLIAQGIDPSQTYNFEQMERLYWNCCFTNREASTKNLNMWNSAAFLDNYIRKAASRNVLLTSKLEAVSLNDTQATMEIINNFYYQLDALESLDNSFKMATIKVESDQSIRTVEAIMMMAESDCQAWGLPVNQQHLKLVYARAVKDIYDPWCYAKLKPILENNTQPASVMIKEFESIVRDKGLDINKVYKGVPRENNDYAKELALKMKNITKSGNKTSLPNSKLNTPEVFYINSNSKCTHPRCRKERKFASHLAKECKRRPGGEWDESTRGNNKYKQYGKDNHFNTITNGIGMENVKVTR